MIFRDDCKTLYPDVSIEFTDKEIDELAKRMQKELGGHIFHSKIDWSRPTPWMTKIK